MTATTERPTVGTHGPAPRRAQTPRVRRAGRRPGLDAVPWWLRLLAAAVALFFVLPTLFVIPMSFSSSTTFSFPPQGFSLDLYRNFFTDPVWLTSLRNSVFVATAAAVLATVVGTAAAVGLHALTGRVAGLARTVLMISIVTPGIVVAVAVYVSFLRWHLVGSFWGYTLAHAAIGVPFVVVSVTSALGGFDAKLLRAAASLGASPWRAFRSVTLPLISRGVVTGAVFAFVTSFDEVVIALFLRSPTFQTLPVQMFNSVTFEVDPTIAASSSLVVTVVTVICLVPLLLGRTRPSRQEKP